jgi:hypothetical protein
MPQSLIVLVITCMQRHWVNQQHADRCALPAFRAAAPGVLGPRLLRLHGCTATVARHRQFQVTVAARRAASAAAWCPPVSSMCEAPVPASLDGCRAAVQLAACRGKLMGAKPPHALGPLSDWTVPQRWFAHFYALGAVWNAALAYLLLGSHYYGLLPRQQQATCALALGLLQLHLTRRLLETVGLMRYPAGARMHGIAYIFGLRWVACVWCGAEVMCRVHVQALSVQPIPPHP